ncbi:MAG: serpin family protein [Dysgonamonadaceae bacterium]|jgi:serpin B|nr:serpin family protein [Dysgonamonadaceae bacterium]
MKKVLLTIMFVGALTACDADKSEDTTEYTNPISINLSEVEQKLAAEGQTFGMELFAAVMKAESKKENIVISPLSLNIALAMVWNGANGDTRAAIQEAMGMSNYPQETVNAYFKKLKEILLQTDPTTKLSLANSIWSRKGFPFKDSFFSINREWYEAQVSELDFNDPGAIDIINKWCSDNTNGLIKEMVQQIPSDIVMYLMNALYFKGCWSDGFGFPAASTADADFTKTDGSTIKVKMMSQKSKQQYYTDENLALTSIPYGNGAFRMVFVLPNGSFDALTEQLKTAGYLSTCLNSAHSTEVNLYIPKFKTGYEIKLNEPLETLGMGMAFTYFADFSGISDIRLCISEVKQKTYIDVNEEGTEAAAVTSVGMGLTSVNPTPQPATFRADRPFLFLIQETSTNIILFEGKIGAPEY